MSVVQLALASESKHWGESSHFHAARLHLQHLPAATSAAFWTWRCCSRSMPGMPSGESRIAGGSWTMDLSLNASELWIKGFHGDRMLGWIERVVPQPPVPHLTEETSPAPVQDLEPAKASTGKAGGPRDAAGRSCTEEMEKKVGFAVPEDPGSVFESVGSSVLSWLSQGLEKVIPQPVPAPGMLQALGKSFEMSIDIPDQTEVQILRDEEEDALEITPFDPEEDELDGCEPEAGSDTSTEEWAGAQVFSWLVQGFERMVPQPEMLKKPEPEPKEQKCEAVVGGTKGAKTQPKSKSSISATKSIPGTVEPAAAKGQLEPVATLIPQSLAGDGSREWPQQPQVLWKKGAKGLRASETNGKRRLWRASPSHNQMRPT